LIVKTKTSESEAVIHDVTRPENLASFGIRTQKLLTWVICPLPWPSSFLILGSSIFSFLFRYPVAQLDENYEDHHGWPRR